MTLVGRETLQTKVFKRVRKENSSRTQRSKDKFKERDREIDSDILEKDRDILIEIERGGKTEI